MGQRAPLKAPSSSRDTSLFPRVPNKQKKAPIWSAFFVAASKAVGLTTRLDGQSW